MVKEHNVTYYKMYDAYCKNEYAYWLWAKEVKLYNKYLRQGYYYKTKLSNKKRKENALSVLRDFPHASLFDVKNQVSTSLDKLWSFGFWEKRTDPYWDNNEYFDIYKWLKKCPDDIYYAIEETYQFSMWVGVRTTVVREFIPVFLNDIGSGRIW